MADEEVDWGVEDVGVGVGEWSNGTADGPTADEDVLSLAGDEPAASTEAEEMKDTAIEEKQTAPVEIEKKAPPTGPRRSFGQPASATGQASTVPTPSATSRSSPSTTESRGGAGGGQQNVDAAVDGELPPGWEKLTSRTHGKVFYYKRDTNETSWTFPKTTTTTQVEPSQPTKEEKQVSAVAVASPTTAKAVPSGPASWRQSNAEIDRKPPRQRSRSPPSAPRSATVHRRSDDHESDWERRMKRSRMTSPPTGPSASANDRYPPPRSDVPPRRARSPPPAAPSGPSRSGSSFRNDPPPGPRGPAVTAPIRQPTGPGLETNGFDRNRREIEPPRGPRPENQAPAPLFARGSNQAPLMSNRWGSSSGSATPTGSTPAPPPATAAKPTAPATSTAEAPAADERAKLQEKKRKMQEELEKIAKEEERLEKLEADKKQKQLDEDKVRKDAEDKKRLEDDRRRKRDLEDDRRREDERRRDGDRRRVEEREDPRRYRPSAGPRSPPPRRPLSPPPLSSRLDPYARRSPPPPRRRSPPPSRQRSPVPPSLARMSSPPTMGSRGDSYRPDRDGGSVLPRDLASRLGGRREPTDAFAERMSALPPRPSRDRPLADRMAPDDRDRRYTPRDRDDRRW